ncbi:hypothetical protein ACHAWU_008147 [Discostella pseudostelligera]|uniref:Uncharacterized protein n=1 Tax=Discostella pseudostelligera TaxID=259834 RepID=A0ABD3MER6_9STRA
MSVAPVSFSVTYVFPTSKITSTCVNTYPIRVIITAAIHNEPNNNGNSNKGGGVIIWEGDQKSLFRKYGTRRQKAMEEIVHKLNAFKSSRL